MEVQYLYDGDNPWREKKLTNLYISDSYRRLGIKDKYNLLLSCSSFLTFRLYESGEKKLNDANFCRSRLCPMCSWRKSRKQFNNLSNVINIITNKYNYQFLFLTLTIKNCEFENLGKHIDILLKGYDLLFKLRGMSFIKGAFRTLEITVNKNDKSFHPHLHIVLAVPKNYYKKYYIKQSEWSEIWKKCIKVDYEPICFVEKFKNNINKSVLELSKYVTKDSDIIILDDLDLMDSIVYYLDKFLAGRRLSSYRGVFKDVYKLLKLEDPDISDLIFVGDEELNKELNYIIIHYNWNIGFSNYIKVGD